MGAAVVAELVANAMHDDPPAALILLSPFTSSKALLSSHKACNCLDLSCLMANHFDTENLIEKIKCPLLLIHGEEDKLIPPVHSEKLYERAVKMF